MSQFDPLESFGPTRVQSFIADSDLEQLVAGTWVVVNSDPEPGELPGPGAGIWRPNQDSCTPTAPIGGLACYAAAWDEGRGGPVVYGRVAREDGRIVLQYGTSTTPTPTRTSIRRATSFGRGTRATGRS